MIVKLMIAFVTITATWKCRNQILPHINETCIQTIHFPLLLSLLSLKCKEFVKNWQRYRKKHQNNFTLRMQTLIQIKHIREHHLSLAEQVLTMCDSVIWLILGFQSI